MLFCFSFTQSERFFHIDLLITRHDKLHSRVDGKRDRESVQVRCSDLVGSDLPQSWHHRQEECLSPTPSTCHTHTALFCSLFTGRDIDSVDSRAHSSCVLHSPLSGSSVHESCAQDTEQIQGKHGSGALLNLGSHLFFVC